MILSAIWRDHGARFIQDHRQEYPPGTRQGRAHAGTDRRAAENLPAALRAAGARRRPASLEQIARIAQVLEVSTASLLSGCTLDGIFTIPPDDSAEAVAGAIAHLAGGCSPKARKLMLSVCRDIAERDRTVDEES